MTENFIQKPTSKLILILLLISFSFSVQAQTIFCPPNIDFENGNLNNWEFSTGNCCPISTPNPGIVANRHTLTSGTNVDPYGNFPIVAISGGSFSLKLGNNISGSQAEQALYYIHVPNTTGKHILLYRYAVVLEDPGHPVSDQPRFQVSAFDSITKDPLPCADISYVASSSLPGFIKSNVSNSNVYYKPWTTATIDLSAYAGRTVAITFTSADCGFGGHFGYGYVDMNCGLFQIQGTICDSAVNQITLNGPQGYQAYEWRDASLTTVLGTSQTLIIPPPSGPTTFAVILTPYPGFGCQDTIYTTYTTPVHSSISLNAYGDTTICIGAKTRIRGVATGPDGPFTYQWSPPTGLSCTLCDFPYVTGTQPTVYSVRVNNILGCADTGYVFVGVDSFVKANLVAPDTVCSSSPIVVKNTLPNNQPTRIQTWQTGGGVILSGGGQSDSVELKYNFPGAKKVALIITLGDCRTEDTVDVFIGTEFNITVSPGDTICPGADKLITVNTNATNPLTYSWIPSSSLSCNNCPNPTAKPSLSTVYTVYATDNLGCYDTGYVTIGVDTATYADFLASRDTICVNEMLEVKNTGSNPAIIGYQWFVDKGSIVYGIGTDSINVFWTTPGSKTIIHRTYRGICETIDTQQVEVLVVPQADFELPPYACVGEEVSMYPLEGAPNYKWNVPDHFITDDKFKESYKLSWNVTGTKTIKLVVNDKHCIDSVTKDIGIYPFPIAEIDVEGRTTICKGKELKMTATKGNRYVYGWEPARVFNTNNQPEVIATVERTEGYYLHVTNQWGCTSHDTIVIDADMCCDVPMADAFTPNGDGHNDKFKPVDMSRKTLIRFMIANRRGQVVFETSNVNDAWDGTHNGQPAGQDTYNYYIKYICDDTEEIVKKGTIILLR